jgi:DNA-binding CsgD family transcriptional regulator
MATTTAWEGQRACCCDAVHLTDREIDVLCALASGATSEEVAAALTLSRRTVDSHVGSMLRKSGARNRGELLAVAVAHHVVDMSAGAPSRTGRSCLPARALVKPTLLSGR